MKTDDDSVWRMIVRGAFQDGWSNANQEEKDGIFEAWISIHRTWQEMGCRLIATLDDELNMVGQPGARLWNFYSIWEIPTPGMTKELLDPFRTENPEAIRLDRYFRFELVVGRSITSMENSLGGPVAATPST